MSTPSDPSTIDLAQARRRAKELLAAVRAGDPNATLVHPHDPPRLADAHHTIARSHGFTSWTALVRAVEPFDPVAADDIDWDRIREVSIVCLPATGIVSLYDDGGRWVIPHDQRRPSEHVWDETLLRIPLERMGFRRQGTHVFAIDRARRHVVFWVDGAPYTGNRPHRDDANVWSGPADDAAEVLRGQGDLVLADLVTRAATDQATMSYERHQQDLQRTLTGGYLRAPTLAGGSGFGGDEQDWHDAREVLTAALEGLPEDLGRPDQPISFLDLGCANGHLAASFVRWGAARGVEVEPYGLDLSPELVARAQELHPQWSDRFWVGDASLWHHPTGRRFDLAHLLLDVFPDDHQERAVRHALSLVTPGGRLLVSNYETRAEFAAERIVTSYGFDVVGRTPVRVRRQNQKPYGTPSVWIRSPPQ